MSNVVEFLSFTLKKGVSVSDFLFAHENFHREFVSMQKGYISHQLLVNGEKYFDLVVWKTMEDKDKAFEAVNNHQTTIELMSFIDQTGTDKDIPIFSVIKNY